VAKTLVLLKDPAEDLLPLVLLMVDLHMEDLQVDLHHLELILDILDLEVTLLHLEVIQDNIILDQDLSMEVIHPQAIHPMVHHLEQLPTTMDPHLEHLDTTLVLPLADLHLHMEHLDLMVHPLVPQVDLHLQGQMDLQHHQTEPWDILPMEVHHLEDLWEVTVVDLHLPVTFRNWRTPSIRWKKKE